MSARARRVRKAILIGLAIASISPLAWAAALALAGTSGNFMLGMILGYVGALSSLPGLLAGAIATGNIHTASEVVACLTNWIFYGLLSYAVLARRKPIE